MPEKADPVSALREAAQRVIWMVDNHRVKSGDGYVSDEFKGDIDTLRAALSGEAPDRDGEIERIAETLFEAMGWPSRNEGYGVRPFAAGLTSGDPDNPEWPKLATALYDAGLRAPSLEGAPDRDGEIAATTRALWDCGVLAGMDTDGDEGPGAIIAGMGIEGFARAMVGAVGELRDSYDECLDEPAAPALEGARHPEAGETPNAAALYSVLDWANRITSANRPPTPPKPGPDKEHG